MPSEQAQQLAELHLLVAIAEARDFEAVDQRDQFVGALDAAIALRAVAQSERGWWLDAFEGAGRSHDDALDEDDGPQQEPLLGLKAVIPGPTEPRNGVLVKALECYSGGVLVHWRRTGPLPPHAAPDDNIWEFVDDAGDGPELSDDVGSDYWSDGGGADVDAAGGSWIEEGASTAYPGVPKGARRVTVHLAGETFDFDVSGVAERAAV